MVLLSFEHLETYEIDTYKVRGDSAITEPSSWFSTHEVSTIRWEVALGSC